MMLYFWVNKTLCEKAATDETSLTWMAVYINRSLNHTAAA